MINNDNWQGGYTGTMLENGTPVDCSSMGAADLVFYGTAYPGEHVAIFTGYDGVTIGHGGPGLDAIEWDQMGMPVLSCRRYI